MLKDKKAQIAIWVVLALVLAGSIILFFTLGRGPKLVGPGDAGVVFDEEAYITSCVNDIVEESLDAILPRGGFKIPLNSRNFNDTKLGELVQVEYICENRGFYYPCIQQHPMLLNEMKAEIRKDIAPRISGCFDSFKEEVENAQGNVIFDSPLDIEVYLEPDRIFIDVKRDVRITKQEETRRFRGVRVETISPVYNLAVLAMEIASQEADYCYFEYVGYKTFYPRYTVKKYVLSDYTRIYTLIDTETDEHMNIAVRSCAIPPGL